MPESTGPPDPGVPGLDAVADELYALPPDAFVPARDDRVAAAKEAGDRDLARAVARLRRPTRAAWLANLLARHRAEQLDGLVALARALARAQQELDGGTLRALSTQRHKAVAAMARDAGRLAARHGEAVSDALLRELQGILDAALADPAVAEEVRAGRLTKSVRYSGFGPPEGVADDMAAWAPAPAPEPPPRTGRAGDGTGGGADAAGGEDGPDSDGDGDTDGGADAHRATEREHAERERAERERAERERAAALRAEREQALADAEDAEAEARARLEADEADRDRADAQHAAARARVVELVTALDSARTEEQEALDAAHRAAGAARAAARDAAAAAVRTTRARTRLEQLPPPP